MASDPVEVRRSVAAWLRHAAAFRGLRYVRSVGPVERQEILRSDEAVTPKVHQGTLAAKRAPSTSDGAARSGSAGGAARAPEAGTERGA
ncbi:MAG: hypothetical protein D6705_05175, partial [Deltaproteobacteria bacterium]